MSNIVMEVLQGVCQDSSTDGQSEVKSCKYGIFDSIKLLLMAFVVIDLVNHADESVYIF